MAKRKATPPSAPLRVVIVDDHDVVRSGLRMLLESSGDISVVGEASDQARAVAVAREVEPDVVVMDVRLADGSGIEATREIRSRTPRTRVVMLTSYADDEALVASTMAGASGYVLKEVRSGEIIQSVRAVGRGENLLDAGATEPVAERLRKGKHLLDDKLARLSPQEERILEHVAMGETNGEIAERLKLAEKTVKNYVSNILAKLEVARRAEAAAYLARRTTPLG